ncbi:cytochrome bd oxidase small subunit CydS [Bacillus litorisediminis]
MDGFLVFYAPILFVILSIIIAFWVAQKDESVGK